MSGEIVQLCTVKALHLGIKNNIEDLANKTYKTNKNKRKRT